MKLPLITLLAGSVLQGGILWHSSAADYQTVVMADSPAAYWRLGEDVGPAVHDLTGAHDGTALSGVVFGCPGALAGDTDTACRFGRTHVEIPDSTALHPRAFSVECWARYTGTDLRRGTALRNECFIIYGGVTWDFWMRVPGAGFYCLFGPKLQVNEWTHLVGTFDGTNRSFFVNGVLVDKMANTNYDWQMPGPLYIGGVDPEYFPGEIDEVAIYDHTLRPERIRLHYAAGRYNTDAPLVILQEPASQTTFAGARTELAITACGISEPHFQWWKDGTPISGATSSSISFTNIVCADTGDYSVFLTNDLGATNSQHVKLAVMPRPLFCNLTNDLVLHLKFDGDYVDSSGRLNHGLAVGSPSFTDGKIGSAALHYSTDVGGRVYNYVTLGRPSDLRFGSDVNFSVAYWVRFTGLPGDLPFLCNTANSFGNPGFVFAPTYKSGGWSWSLGSGSGFMIEVYGETNTINDGNWHHLLHSFDRDGRGITYLDGVKSPLASGIYDSVPVVMRPVDSLDTGGPVNIGQDSSGRYPESGAIDLDDLGVWRRVLSPYEAQLIYLVGNDYHRSFDTYGPVQLVIQSSPTGIEIMWQQGTLEAADEVTGPWAPVDGASAPYCKIAVAGTRKFYRAKL